MSEVWIKYPAGVGDLPCITSMVQVELIFPCTCFCNIIMTGEPTHTTCKETS